MWMTLHDEEIGRNFMIRSCRWRGFKWLWDNRLFGLYAKTVLSESGVWLFVNIRIGSD
jgi:hypothetical protein